MLGPAPALVNLQRCESLTLGQGCDHCHCSPLLTISDRRGQFLILETTEVNTWWKPRRCFKFFFWYVTKSESHYRPNIHHVISGSSRSEIFHEPTACITACAPSTVRCESCVDVQVQWHGKTRLYSLCATICGLCQSISHE